LASRSLWDQDLAVPAMQAGTVRLLRLPGPQRQYLLVHARGYVKQGRALSIAVAEDLTAIADDIHAFQWRYAMASVIALAALLLLQYFAVRTGLRPLEQVRRELLRLERGDVQALHGAMPAEIAPLVAQINRLLGTLGQRLQRSRNALGNLAHALKTPLTLLAQLSDRPELRACPELRDGLRVQIDALRAIADRELKRARLAGGGAVGQRVALTPEVDGLVQTLRSIYRDKGLSIETRVPDDAVFHGDREDIVELLGNLLDNACKWAHQRVTLSIRAAPLVALRVEDDGPGCDPELLEQLTRRGVRADESTSGHGLGLAIAQDIVDQYGGRIRFGRSERLGGFLVDVELPDRWGLTQG
jgi:signal transduction histidine kinase